MKNKRRAEMNLPDWFIKFMYWVKEHPYKTMLFITLPICVLVSSLTTILLSLSIMK